MPSNTLLCLLLALAALRAEAQAPLHAGKDYAVFFYVTRFQPGWQPLPETEIEAKALKAELESAPGEPAPTARRNSCACPRPDDTDNSAVPQ